MAEKVHTADQVSAFLAELITQTDRGVAVIAAAVLDEVLQMLILARLIEIGSERKESLFKKTGAPLSTFSAKIELAFALGAMNNEARLACHLIRDIRNKFAHRIDPLYFDHPEVAEILDARIMESVKDEVEAAPTRRDKFLMTFQALAAILYGTLRVDIRIKSLQETHLEFFLKMAAEAMLHAQPPPLSAQQSRAPGQHQGPSEPSKRE